ncbi:MAG: SDR family oxidoreductase [Planctomycetes bacterium]|nr:SDR family oxidoreductase [Planctomycetota bacterium]
MPRTVITGGAGFLGSHLCDHFLAQGHEVICIDNLLTGNASNIGHLASVERFQFIERSVTEPIELEGAVDHVLHFASPASPTDYLRFPIETLQAGSAGTRHALELARAGNARFLLASTSEVYGDPQVHPQREDYWGNVNPIGHRSVYDEAKRFAEALTMAYHRAYGVETRIVRIFNTYGPRMRLEDGRALPNFLSQALGGRDITIYGDGSQTRSFCYVDDTVAGIARLLDSSEILPVNVGNPSEITILEFAKAVLELTGSTSRLHFQPFPEGYGDDPKVRRPDIGRARSKLHWEPKVPLREGLNRTIEYFKARMRAGGQET